MQSPKTLQELCISSLAEEPEILWRRKGGSKLSEQNGVVEWRDKETFLISQFADSLLEILSYDKTLRHGILRTFTQEHACLKNVKIYNSNCITENGLQVFSHHKLISLHIENLHRVNMCTLLKCIGNKSYESLQHLILQLQWPMFQFWPHDDDLAGQSVVKTLSRFNCLKSVDINNTNLTNTMLTILGKSLLHVKSLDISRNEKITDISPLKNCQKTLKSLSLGWLPDMRAESAMATFVTLTGLTYLDVSLVTGCFGGCWRVSVGVSDGMKVFAAEMLLELPDVLPNLKCLDLSGRNVSSEQALSHFLDAHPSLQMLVLWRSATYQFKSLQDYRPQLTVGGDATLEQYAAVLRHWTRAEELKGMSYYRHQVLEVTIKLSSDLRMKDFAPCEDDQLVQAVLGILTARSSHHCDRLVGRFQQELCLYVIYLLLKRKIVRQLEPDTKQHLLPICQKAVWKRRLKVGHRLAQKILQALKPPQNHNE